MDFESKCKKQFSWKISKILRNLFYVKQCPMCGKMLWKFGKVNSLDLYMDEFVFWGVPIHSEFESHSKCRRNSVVILSPNTKEKIVLNKKDMEHYSVDKRDFLEALWIRARGKIVVVRANAPIIEGELFSLTITGVEKICPITDHNIEQLILRYFKEDK